VTKEEYEKAKKNYSNNLKRNPNIEHHNNTKILKFFETSLDNI